MSLSEFNKKIKSDSKIYWHIREWYVILYSLFSRFTDSAVADKKKRLLFYHINSLGYAGTEKMIQILAKYLDKNKYDVFYLYPNYLDTHPDYQKRLDYLKEGGIIGIPFVYDKVQNNPPYFVEGMNPNINALIDALHIDLLITPAAGTANYPFSTIRGIPIFLLNIFGQPNVQHNIRYHLCISKEVGDKLSPVVPDNKIKIYPVPSEGPLAGSELKGKELRNRLGIKETAMVFGRIGRADNAIFDPIGIRAFQKVGQSISSIEQQPHYIIMSPAPMLVELVEKEQIPNVHFLDPSSNEDDVWAFHQAIDALAHFRNDGESFGLNIVESMLCSKPIITHKSHIWNAHLEYLEPSFSRIAPKDDIDTYAQFMKEFIELHTKGTLKGLGDAAHKKAQMFLIENNIKTFEQWIDETL